MGPDKSGQHPEGIGQSKPTRLLSVFLNSSWLLSVSVGYYRFLPALTNSFRLPSAPVTSHRLLPPLIDPHQLAHTVCNLNG